MTTWIEEARAAAVADFRRPRAWIAAARAAAVADLQLPKLTRAQQIDVAAALVERWSPDDREGFLEFMCSRDAAAVLAWEQSSERTAR